MKQQITRKNGRVGASVLYALVAGLILSACHQFQPGQQLVNSPKLTPDFAVADTFSTELARKYWLMSETSTSYRKPQDSRYFADKAIRAGKGIHTDPEHPEDWNVRYTALKALKEARRALLDVATSEVIAQAPKATASAYFLYDCWVEQESHWETNQLSNCRTQFFDALNNLSVVHQETQDEDEIIAIDGVVEVEDEATTPEGAEPLPATQTPKADSETDATTEETEATETEQPAVETVDIGEVRAYFDFDKYDITDEARAEVERFAAAATQAPDSRIIINGHADRAGPESYNFKLSRERARAVRTALVDLGIDQKRILVFGFGETDPDVPTDDDVREPKNRRAEMLLN